MDEEQQIEPGAAGAPEGAVAEPTTDDVAKMYKELGIKAPAPTGATKGRPKASDVRAKDGSKKAAGNSSAGKKAEDDDNGSKSKDAPAADADGDSGNKADPKSAKVGEDADQVPDESKKADAGVRKTEPAGEGDSKRGSEEDTELGVDGAGQGDDESQDAPKPEDEGKRPGKSNPEIEKRFQKLTSEVKDRDQLIADLQKKLQDTTQKQQEERIAQEDPEYTIDDFRKVRDNEGNIIDLDPERAELAWRRWKDGYDQRAEEREAKSSYEARQQQQADETTRQLMQDSADAYDALAELMDEYPELVSTSDQFDPDFAKDAMPIINESVQYLEGTEPGNPEGKTPVVVGLKINPKRILAAMKGINNKKRSLPLNGVNDNVEPRSNVAVPHSRSSDPTVNAANDLYKELGINKRI